MRRARIDRDVNRAVVEHASVNDVMMLHMLRVRAVDADALGRKSTRKGGGGDNRLQEALRDREQTASFGAVRVGVRRIGVELHRHPLSTEQQLVRLRGDQREEALPRSSQVRPSEDELGHLAPTAVPRRDKIPAQNVRPVDGLHAAHARESLEVAVRPRVGQKSE